MWNFTKHLINQAAGMRTITSGQRDFGEETISTHQIEEFAEFFALVDLLQIYIEIPDDCCVLIFAL